MSITLPFRGGNGEGQEIALHFGTYPVLKSKDISFHCDNNLLADLSQSASSFGFFDYWKRFRTNIFMKFTLQCNSQLIIRQFCWSKEPFVLQKSFWSCTLRIIHAGFTKFTDKCINVIVTLNYNQQSIAGMKFKVYPVLSKITKNWIWIICINYQNYLI